MSDFGLFEAASDAEQEPRRRERIAARQMTSALQDVHAKYAAFVSKANGVDGFEDRWGTVRRDVAKTMIAHGVGAYPAVMREAHGSLKSAWYQKYSLDHPDDRQDGDTKPPKNDGDRDRTITDHQYSQVKDGDYKSRAEDVDSNHGDGSDASGNHPAKKHESRRRVAQDQDAPVQNLAVGREHNEGDLIPDSHNDPSTGESSGVQRDFGRGGDTGTDAHHREAMQMVADIYNDWAIGNGFRVASMNTLDLYASRGLHDRDYFLLASLIRQAEEDCECEDDDDDSDSVPPKSSGDESSDSGDDSDGDDDSDESYDDDDSESDDNEDDNPFGDSSDNSGEPADDGSDEGSNDAGPSDSGNPFETEDGGDPAAVGDPAEDPASADPSSVGGQDFTVPEQAPDLPGDEMSQLQQGGPESVPPEIIDDILGLPPGTLEQLINEELNGGGGGGAPPSEPPPGPPQQLARRKVRAAEDPTQAAGASAPAAAPGGGSAGVMPPPGSASVAPPQPPLPTPTADEGATLDTAMQAVTQMVDQKTQEYQQVIDPLNQALQAIQFAQQVEQAENPLDVTPPQGTVDATPAAAPGGANSMEQKAAAIANRYDLSVNGYRMLMTAMSRKHYEHVAEAIRTLPPELRPGIAHHIGGMFSEDNPRFNHDVWMNSMADRPLTASRRPFVAGENSKNTQMLDSFEFPGQGAEASNPEITDNIAMGALPKPPKGMKPLTSGVLDKYQTWKTQQQSKGLGYGGDQSVEGFFNQPSNEGYGTRARNEVHQSEGIVNESAPQKVGSFFTRRVPGWTWDDHQNGYISKNARQFTCSCGNTFATPSYGTCKCGKLWNSYAIGDNDHLASNSAEMYVTREIPVREDVIMANKRMAWTSSDGWTPPDQRDTEWVDDEDREDADAPKAPQKNAYVALAWDAARVAGSQMIGEPVGRHDDPKFQGVVSGPGSTPEHFMVDHPGGQSEMSLYDLASGGPGPAPAPSLKDRVRQHLVDRMNRTGPPGGFAGGRSAKTEPYKKLVRDDEGHEVWEMHDGTNKFNVSSDQDARKTWDEITNRNAKLKDDDYIVKYDDDEDPARKDGPKKPPSTQVKGNDPKWHSRGDGGKFKNTSPFGG